MEEKKKRELFSLHFFSEEMQCPSPDFTEKDQQWVLYNFQLAVYSDHVEWNCFLLVFGKTSPTDSCVSIQYFLKSTLLIFL